MPENLRLSTVLPVAPQRIYTAWLSSTDHAAFTGSQAEIDPAVGGKFTAWDGYIQGTNLVLAPFNRIVQTWRTTDFPDGSADSRLEVLFEPVQGGAKVTLVHSDIPDGQGDDYERGWRDYYFAPMRDYFAGGH